MLFPYQQQVELEIGLLGGGVLVVDQRDEHGAGLDGCADGLAPLVPSQDAVRSQEHSVAQGAQLGGQVARTPALGGHIEAEEYLEGRARTNLLFRDR